MLFVRRAAARITVALGKIATGMGRLQVFQVVRSASGARPDMVDVDFVEAFRQRLAAQAAQAVLFPDQARQKGTHAGQAARATGRAPQGDSLRGVPESLPARGARLPSAGFLPGAPGGVQIRNDREAFLKRRRPVADWRVIARRRRHPTVERRPARVAPMRPWARLGPYSARHAEAGAPPRIGQLIEGETSEGRGQLIVGEPETVRHDG